MRKGPKKEAKRNTENQGDKETAGSDDQNAQKLVIRPLLIVSIDHFQKNLRIIRLGRTTFFYE